MRQGGMWGGVSPPHRGKGLCPLPRKCLDFWAQNGKICAFWVLILLQLNCLSYTHNFSCKNCCCITVCQKMGGGLLHDCPRPDIWGDTSPCWYATVKHVINWNKPALTRMQRPASELFLWLVTLTSYILTQNKWISSNYRETFVCQVWWY